MRLRHVFALTLSLAAVAVAPASAAGFGGGPDGLTVTGQGTATADAALIFFVRVGAKPGAGTPTSQSLGDLEGPPRALAAALTAAGATQVSIGFEASLSNANPAPFVVRGVLERPTHDRILSLILSGALATLPDGSPIAVATANGQLVPDDCAALERGAEDAALDDAVRRAKALAAHARVALGRIEAIGPVAAPCVAASDALRGAGYGGGSPLPLDGPYRIVISSTATVTFSLR